MTKLIYKTIKNLIRNEIKYEGYISRQFEEIEKIEKYKNIEIPKNLDIAFISGLSNELKQKIQNSTFCRRNKNDY